MAFPAAKLNFVFKRFIIDSNFKMLHKQDGWLEVKYFEQILGGCSMNDIWYGCRGTKHWISGTIFSSFCTITDSEYVCYTICANFRHKIKAHSNRCGRVFHNQHFSTDRFALEIAENPICFNGTSLPLKHIISNHRKNTQKWNESEKEREMKSSKKCWWYIRISRKVLTIFLEGTNTTYFECLAFVGHTVDMLWPKYRRGCSVQSIFRWLGTHRIWFVSAVWTKITIHAIVSILYLKLC